MPEYDAQSRAFREATPEDSWDGNISTLLLDFGATQHRPIEDVRDIRLPDQFESDSWDTGRERPKSLTEAKEALLARINDPHAPDGEESRGAYDGDV